MLLLSNLYPKVLFCELTKSERLLELIIHWHKKLQHTSWFAFFFNSMNYKNMYIDTKTKVHSEKTMTQMLDIF